jgi:hypothetical protein
MAIEIISSIEKTTSPGTIVVPATCTLIVAVVDGSVTPPTISGISMGEVGIVEATSIIPAISIHQFREPEIATLAYTYIGTTCEFIFIADGDSYRPGTLSGYNAGGVYEGNLPSSDEDLVIAILHGSIGPTTLETDEVEMTYLKESTLVKIGYVLAGAALIACLASDTGVSEGYWADGGQYWVEGSYIPQWYEYIPHWIPGHWTSGNPVWVPGAWVFSGPPDYNNVWVPGHFEYVDVWVPGFYDYDWIVHPAETVPGHYEDYPDVWVEAGSSQISAIFASISSTPGGGFVSRPIMFT